MIYSVNLLVILVPIILLQYGLSLFCLVKLVFLDLPKKKFWLWNFFILIVVVIGVVSFLVCYFKFRDKVFPKKPEAEEPAPEVSEQTAAEHSEIFGEKPVAAAPQTAENATPEQSDSTEE